jgi:uncharacterized protein
MGRLFLLLALLLLAALIYRAMRKQKVRGKPDKKQIISKNMTKCDYCGLHVPEEEVLQYKGRNYCSERHKFLDQSRN